MKGITAVIWAEGLKIRKSKIFLFTIVGFIFIPLMMGVFIIIARNPVLVRQLGLIGTKASMFIDADWPAYFELLNQMLAALGLIGFGFVLSWVFGREYADHTLKDLLAMPVSRSLIVAGKYLVSLLWCILLAFVLLICELMIGGIVKIAGWTSVTASSSLSKYVAITLLTIWVSTPIAFFASYGRGYLAALGFVILTLIMANLIGVVGLGPYFPWAIPGMLSIASPSAGMQLSTASYLILLLTGLAGLLGTFSWYRFADQV